MNLMDIINRVRTPAPWAEGENIPWNEPAFSERMLREHLAQTNDHASRRAETIDRQVQWIHQSVLNGDPSRILDLACGPGFYTSRLSQLGHECAGIDYAPAAVRHAEETARREGLSCTHRLEDVREADYGEGYNLAMMIFGQFNVFRRREARRILEKAFAALLPEGLLLLEPQRSGTVRRNGGARPSWCSVPSEEGLFSERPHLCLIESFWDSEEKATTERYFVVDAASGAVQAHALTTEAYTDEEYRDVLTEVGFTDIRFLPSLVGVEVDDVSQSANLAIVARRPAVGSEE